MSAHLRAIPNPKCWCGKRATETLYNTWNAPLQDLCGRHAKSALREALAHEKTEYARLAEQPKEPQP